MLKKILLSLCGVLIVFLYLWGDFSLVGEYYEKVLKTYIFKDKILPEYKKGTIHIYIEEATFPTELQLIDIVQRSKDTPKIISWNWERFPSLKGIENYNATLLNFSFRPELKNYDKSKIKTLIKELKNLKDNDFIIHTNLLWVESIIPLLKELPREKIKHIYLYEDGLANLLALTSAIPAVKMDNPAEKIRQLINSKEKFSNKYAYLLHKLYPVTYRISFWNEFKQKKLIGNFSEVMQDANVENVDIQKIAEKLTAEQKSELFKILDFDADFYKEIIKNKKVHFFVIAHYLTYDDKDLQAWFKQHNNPDDVLFIKGNNDMLNNRLIPAYVFPNQIPFEILIISGLTPNSVSGVASSLFYALPAENIGYIIYDEKDQNAGIIKQLKNLTDKQIKISDVKFFQDEQPAK